MSDVIIDTNVIVVANHQNDQVSQACSDSCTTFLVRAKEQDVVLLDSAGEIIDEYARALRMSRPYQLGGQFLIHVFQQMYNVECVRQVPLAKTEIGAFEELPEILQDFDRSDQKFAVLSIVTGAPVINAIDSDWVERLGDLETAGVQVEFLCGDQPARWFV